MDEIVRNDKLENISYLSELSPIIDQQPCLKNKKNTCQIGNAVDGILRCNASKFR